MTIFARRDITKGDIVSICTQFGRGYRPMPTRQCRLGVGVWSLQLDVEGVGSPWVYVPCEDSDGDVMELWKDSREVVFPENTTFYIVWREPYSTRGAKNVSRMWEKECRLQMRVLLERHGIRWEKEWKTDTITRKYIYAWFQARQEVEYAKIDASVTAQKKKALEARALAIWGRRKENAEKKKALNAPVAKKRQKKENTSIVSIDAPPAKTMIDDIQMKSPIVSIDAPPAKTMIDDIQMKSPIVSIDAPPAKVMIDDIQTKPPPIVSIDAPPPPIEDLPVWDTVEKFVEEEAVDLLPMWDPESFCVDDFFASGDDGIPFDAEAGGLAIQADDDGELL